MATGTIYVQPVNSFAGGWVQDDADGRLYHFDRDQTRGAPFALGTPVAFSITTSSQGELIAVNLRPAAAAKNHSAANRTARGGGNVPGPGGAQEQFARAVEARVQAGMTRAAAVAVAARERPHLHAAAIAEANPRR